MGIKELLGEELFNTVKSKLGDKELFINDGSYIPRAKLNEVNGKLSAMTSKVTSYEEQIAATKNLLKDNEELKNSYSELNSKFDEQLKIKDKEILNVRKSSLVKEALISSGAKHTRLLMKEIDLDKISLDNDNLIGINDTIDALKKDYEDMFSTKSVKNNNDTAGSSKQEDDDGNFADLFKNIN